MEFRNIKVNIGPIAQAFDFEYHEMTGYGQACKITSAGKTAIVDEDFAVIESDMPDHWLEAAIAKLKELLQGQ